jgi:hypothetical protein
MALARLRDFAADPGVLGRVEAMSGQLEAVYRAWSPGMLCAPRIGVTSPRSPGTRGRGRR